MSKHTPGPWEVERHTAHSGTVATVYGNGGWWEVWSRNDPGQPEANARLIVAAPDMLEALEELVTLKLARDIGFAYSPGDGLDIDGPEYHRRKGPAWAAARAALAKARGES